MTRSARSTALLIVASLVVASYAYGNSTVPDPVETPDLTLDKNLSTDEVLLSWSATTSPYAVVRDIDPSRNSVTSTIAASGLTAAAYNDAGLTDGNDYFYLVSDSNAPPQIIGASVGAARPGESVTLTGFGFAPVLADNRVFIAGQEATVTAVTSTTLTFATPTSTPSGQVVTVTPKGATVGPLLYTVGAQGLESVTSLAIDGTGVPYVAAAGSKDKVWTFDDVAGTKTTVGLLAQANGLPDDANGNIYYGNGIGNNPANRGTIELTRVGHPSVPNGEFVTRCGNLGSCYVWGMGLDPDLVDFTDFGRLYVADGFSNSVRIVEPDGSAAATFASGFNFVDAPRGVTVDRNSTSSFYHDVYVSDAMQVYRYDSSTVPGTLAKTYSATQFPFVTPRQIAIIPPKRNRVVVADSGRGRLVMINPDTDASRVLRIPLDSPRAIAVDEIGATNTHYAWVGEADRVLRVDLPRTVYLSVALADNSGMTEFEVREQIARANNVYRHCGIEFALRGDVVFPFDAGSLLDLETPDFNPSSGRIGCGDPGLVRTAEMVTLLSNATLRSSEPTDINVYVVRQFTNAGNPTMVGGVAVTKDCFTTIDDETDSGVILAGSRVNNINGLWVLAHEIGHVLLNRDNWGTSRNEHLSEFGASLPADNVMQETASPLHWRLNNAQCLNINNDDTIFRGDP